MNENIQIWNKSTTNKKFRYPKALHISVFKTEIA